MSLGGDFGLVYFAGAGLVVGENMPIASECMLKAVINVVTVCLKCSSCDSNE